MPAILSFFPDRQEVRVRQTQLGAIVALETAQKMTRKEINRIKRDVKRALLDKAPTEPGRYSAELKNKVRGGRLVQELRIVMPAAEATAGDFGFIDISTELSKIIGRVDGMAR